MSLKRKSSEEYISPPAPKRAAHAPAAFLPSHQVSPTMHPGYYQSYPEEDFLSGEMFTSQGPTDNAYMHPTASTGMSLETLAAFDPLPVEAMHFGSWGDTQDNAFAPALTPSRESDLSSASSENLDAILGSSSSVQEQVAFEVQPNMMPQNSAIFPMASQWNGPTIDSPMSMPSTYDEALPHDNQLLSLDMEHTAYDPGMPNFDGTGYVSPVSMVNPGTIEQSYPPMDHLGVYPQRSLDHTGRRLSNESSPRDARSDIRYKVRPGPDNLYHCPFADCGHTPEKLKCNYDKHLDAHLRPYRCIREACRSIQFSSTACVLRHEREAHGMHGHGHKPYTCRFPDCERANPENGFPRKWNLKDHMKRVHHYDEEAAQKSASDPMTPPESPSVHSAGPSRVKRSGRASPKPKTSKDDAMKTTSFRKNSRVSVSNVWQEPMIQYPDMHQSVKNEPTWDPASGFPQQWMQ